VQDDIQVAPANSAKLISSDESDAQCAQLGQVLARRLPKAEDGPCTVRTQPIFTPIPVGELNPSPSDWLNLPGVVLEGIIEETDTYVVVQGHASIIGKPVCKTCKSNDAIILWDNRFRVISDEERDKKLIRLVLKFKRRYCNLCKKAFTPPLPHFEVSLLRRTKRLTEQTNILIRERQTTSYIAKKTGLSRRTVQAIATAAAGARPTPQDVFRRATASQNAACVIQIDDAHPSLGPLTSILLNGKPFELLNFYNKDVIERFLFTLAQSHRNKVKLYICDCTAYLFDLGRTYFPEALIVADSFHVIQQIRRCFEALLKPMEPEMLAEYIRAINEGLARPNRGKQGKAEASPKTARDMRNLKKQAKEPTFAEIRILLRTKKWKLDDIQQEAVKAILHRFPEARNSYDYLQGAMALYHTVMSSATASKALERLEAQLSPHCKIYFQDFLKLCRDRRGEICAYWECGWTNAEAEAQNGVIKDIDSRGRGLGYAELRRRWLYGESTTASLSSSQLPVRADAGVPDLLCRWMS
jgi:transposase